ncbi:MULTISPECIES: TetR/AcrR family transcriptional regulator [Marinobacter]|uniref:TetR family transcriptional regulator n=1 Tax=Marinobacter profundi TaxID=2666256 RepID=A0A2G1UHW9_9GAMM|nr:MULTISPECIES: TetR/AcrR family transcriptional regulator [Marinobacter]MBD3658134.1 TetR/AcrR family transcriptional regulator [Marinobacter sp.]PHQ14096.1 TetR family transcriptional regulator [Marinobacter profundi]
MAYRETEKVRQRKQEARNRILECAYACVAEGGFRSAQITAVASRAGIATGTIYRYFDSKEELFAEIFRLATQREVDKVAEALAGAGPAAARLEAALRRFADRALRGPVMAWALIAEPVDPRVETERLQYRRAYADLFEKAIKEGIADNSIPAQDARLSSTCLVGAIAESLVGPLSPGHLEMTRNGNGNPQAVTDKSLVDTIIHFCMQGLTGIRR